MQQSEIQLILEAVGGRAEAFNSLTDRYGKLILGLAYTYVGDLQTAQDIAQEAFLQAWLSLGSLHRPERFGPWLRQIAANLARDHLRRQSRRETLPLEDWDHPQEEAESDLERGLLRAELLKHLQAIPEGPRTAMVLHYLMGLSPAEAAAQLEISRAAFDTRLTRGREALKRELTQVIGDVLSNEQSQTQGYLEGLSARVRDALSAGPRERTIAARELALLAARANLGRLALDLTNPNEVARQKAAHRMAETGDPRAVPPLLQALPTEEEPAVQAEICRSLALLEAMEAIDGLKHLARQAADMAVHKAATEAARTLEAGAFEPIGSDIPVQISDLREAGIETLLMSMLSDPSPQVRSHAADGLGRVESTKSLPALTTLTTEDPQAFVRLTAAEALGAIAGRHRQSQAKVVPKQQAGVIEALCRALTDPDHGTVAEAARSLALIDLTPAHRSQVVEALFAALPELLQRSPGPWWTTLPLLFGHVGGEAEMLRLARIRAENPAPIHNGPLASALEAMSVPGRTVANGLMLAALKSESRDPSSLIRALGRTQDPTIADVVASYLAPASNHPPKVWAAAADALAHLPEGAARLQDVIETALGVTKPADGPVIAAVEALEGVGGMATVAWLEQVAERLPPRARITANAAVRRMRGSR